MHNPFSKASRVLRKHRKKLLLIKGVRGLGVMRASQFGGENIPCLVVYGDSTLKRKSVPEEIEGISVYLVC